MTVDGIKSMASSLGFHITATRGGRSVRMTKDNYIEAFMDNWGAIQARALARSITAQGASSSGGYAGSSTATSTTKPFSGKAHQLGTSDDDADEEPEEARPKRGAIFGFDMTGALKSVSGKTADELLSSNEWSDNDEEMLNMLRQMKEDNMLKDEKNKADLKSLMLKKVKHQQKTPSGSESEDEEVSAAQLIGLGDETDTEDDEVLVLDEVYLHDASDFNPVIINVHEYKGRHLFNIKAFMYETIDSLKENIRDIINSKSQGNANLDKEDFELFTTEGDMGISQTISDFFDGEGVFKVNLRLKLKGGGLSKAVAKHITKSKGEKQVADEDMGAFQATYNTCLQTFKSSSYDINLAIEQMPVHVLEDVKVLLMPGGKKPNSMKLREFHENLQEFKIMSETSEKIVCAMSKFADLVASGLKASFGKPDDGNTIDIEALREKVATTLAIKKDRLTQTQNTASNDVAM